MNVKDLMKQFPKYEILFSNMPTDIDLCIETFDKETVIVQRGDQIDNVMLLVSGDMIVYNEYVSGEVIYVRSDEVTFIGDIELVAGQEAYVCSVMASSDCMAISMDKDDFLRWFNSDPTLMKEIAVRLSKRNCIQSSNFGALKYQSTEERLIKFLIERIDQQELLKNNKQASIKITREHIALQIGASERMINRVISQLKEDDLIQSGYGLLIVTKDNYKRLKSMLV